MTTRDREVTSAPQILYVCLRPAHHRHRAARPELCEHRGCVAYCPAGAAEGHEWMATPTDLRRLARTGICPSTLEEPARGAEPDGDEGLLLLIR